MFQLFFHGRPVMYFLALCSFWGLYIVIQKILFLNLNQRKLQSTCDAIKNQLLSKGKEQTLVDLKSMRTLSGRILSQAIRFSELPREEFQDVVRDVSGVEIPKLERNLNLLSSLVTVAPMLGLLGTVMGLINIFKVISGGQIGDSVALSGGIAEALVATVTGLMIAIPFIFFHHYLSHRVDVFVAELEAAMNDLFRFCKYQKGVRP